MYRDFFIYSAEALALAGGTGVGVRTNIDGSANFDIFRRVATAISRNARVSFFEASSGRTMSDAGVPLAGAFGDGRHPFDLPTPKRLKRASTIINTITDESGVANQIRLAFLGAKVFPQWPFPKPEYVAREAFEYVAPFVPVATDPAGAGAIPAGGTSIFNIRIQEDADFEIRAWSLVYDQAIPAGSDSVALLTLEDTTYNYQFMDRPIPVENLGGAIFSDVSPSGFFPFVLPIPKLLRKASLLQVTVQNLDPANALALRMTFFGSKCYTLAGQ